MKLPEFWEALDYMPSYKKKEKQDHEPNRLKVSLNYSPPILMNAIISFGLFYHFAYSLHIYFYYINMIDIFDLLIWLTSGL